MRHARLVLALGVVLSATASVRGSDKAVALPAGGPEAGERLTPLADLPPGLRTTCRQNLAVD